MPILANARFDANSVLAFPIDRAVLALRRELESIGYNPAIVGEILPFAHDEGCLAGAIEHGMIDPDDAERLTEAFVNGFGELHLSAPEWSDGGVWEDGPEPTPTEPSQDEGEWFSQAMWRALCDAADSLPFEESEMTEIGVSRR